jgi:hypothetical protein
VGDARSIAAEALDECREEISAWKTEFSVAWSNYKQKRQGSIMTEEMNEDPLLTDSNQYNKRHKSDEGRHRDGDKANSPPKKKAKTLELVRLLLLTWAASMPHCFDTCTVC